ncbi:cadmium resistance transporter [Halobacteria archaeon AArc-curdl1]|uniref:Cadmium resistance transporter n=1 Tax=Natronosalvus hydrolyticus TaxID=2979988 RepID=A0AAP3E6A3_9EURY|nr:cadmium resistance transporter [Halobacteria archaeon AArc-curdl1]
METILFLAIWLFLVTHLDALLVMGAFCADNDYQIWEVFIGHYVSFSIGLIAAIIGAIVAAEFLREWTFILGVIPLGIGLWGLIRRPPETSVEHIQAVPNTVGRISVVTITGIGLTGENLAVFIPFFAELTSRELLAVVGVYLIGGLVLFFTALLLVYRVAFDGISDRLDRWLVPTVLVCVGGYVLVSGLYIT